MSKEALEGVKVLELCQLVAGPYCTKLLADLGAEVVKIEEPGGGDAARSLPPFLHDIPDSEGSGLFLYLNTNKFGVTLNVATATGKDIFLELVKQADILVEDNPPQWMTERGLDYQSLKEINPRLIMTSITPFGQSGPYRDYKAYPLNVFQFGGEGYLTPGGVENTGRPPLKVGRFLSEYDSGLSAAIAILAALYWRGESGSGQLIDISKQESLMALNRMDMVRSANEGEVITRAKQGVPYGGALPCRDGYTVFITWESVQWDRLVAFMGDPEWANDDKFRDYAGRYQHGELLNALLTEWLVNHPKEELYHEGQAAGVPFAMVYTSKDLVDSEHLKARGFFVEIDHPRTGKVKYPSAPYKFSETPWQVKRPAPLLGEHNEEVFVRWLGHPREEMAKLGPAGVI
jgi:crotonobetainyl-CoA:carnitine CoA-transferase CaiB-like acyl-CoA transferase